jgi:hypothetical protein
MATRQLPAHQSMTRSFLVWLLSVAPYNRRTNMDQQIFFTIQTEINSESQLRRLAAVSDEIKEDRAYQLRTFDFQWANLPYHDMFLSNPEWRGKAPDDLCRRLDVEPSWGRGEKSSGLWLRPRPPHLGPRAPRRPGDRLRHVRQRIGRGETRMRELPNCDHRKAKHI